MIDKNEVELFLNDFRIKANTWGIIYRDDRGKNTQALLDLEIRPIDRTNIIKALSIEDFSEGPIEEILYRGSLMWVFGKTIKSTEVYIKITLGKPNNKIICISFHIAKYPMNYPFK